MTVADWLTALQHQNAVLREHEHTPLARAQRASASRDALFDTLLVFENYPIARGLGPAAEDLGIGATSAHERTNYPLTFEAAPGAELHLALDAHAIDPVAAHRLLARVARTLAQLASARRVADVALITDDERAQLAAWNATAVALPTAATALTLFEAHADRRPDAIAVVDHPARRAPDGMLDSAPHGMPDSAPGGVPGNAPHDHGSAPRDVPDSTPSGVPGNAPHGMPDSAPHGYGNELDRSAARAPLSYAELEARANQLAWRLIDAGVGPESLVAVCAPHSRELVIALIAIWKAGAAYLPIDPEYPDARIAHMLADARPAVVLAAHRRDGRADPWRDARPDAWPLDELAELTGALGPDRGRPPARARPHHLAYCIYTSGSTGVPKGVAVPHASLVNFLAAMERRLGFDAGGSFLALTSLSFDIAALELWLPLTRGARVVLAKREEAASADRLVQRLAGGDVTAVQATPTTWRTLSPATTPLPRSCTLLCGGEAMPADLAARLVATGARVINVYGPTETTVWSTLHELSPARPEPSIGWPIDNTAIYVLDGALRPVPTGATGALYIGGLGLARGYLRRPALTAERFLPDPFSPTPGARMYCTGDLARYRPDGTLDCLGRSDDQVKLRGHRVELGEIEAALRAQPGVADAAVATRGASEPRLVAYVVCGPANQPAAHGDDRRAEHATNQSATQVAAHRAEHATNQPAQEAALRAALAVALPAVMLPQHYVFLTELPRTANGKLDRRALPDPAVRERPPRIAPRTAAEHAIAEIWSRLLAQPELSMDDDFFALGGDSLVALQAVGAAHAAGFAMSPRDIFEHPTIAGLASHTVSTRAVDVGASQTGPAAHAHAGASQTAHPHVGASHAAHAHVGASPIGPATHAHVGAPQTAHTHVGASHAAHAHVGASPIGPATHAHVGAPQTAHAHVGASPIGPATHAHVGASQTAHPHAGASQTAHAHVGASQTAHAHVGDSQTGPASHAHAGASQTGPAAHAHVGAPQIGPATHAHAGASQTGPASPAQAGASQIGPASHAHVGASPIGPAAHAHAGASQTGSAAHAHVGASQTAHAHAGASQTGPATHAHADASPIGPAAHAHAGASHAAHAHAGASHAAHAHVGASQTAHAHAGASHAAHAHVGASPIGPASHAYAGASHAAHAHVGASLIGPASHAYAGASPIGPAAHAHAGASQIGPTTHAHAGASPIGPAAHAHVGASPIGPAAHAHAGASQIGYASHPHAGASPTAHAHVGEAPTGADASTSAAADTTDFPHAAAPAAAQFAHVELDASELDDLLKDLA